MSLARAGIRVAAVEAIADRTWAEMVADSEIGVIDRALEGQTSAPFVVVYTDDQEDEGPGQDLLANRGALSLVFEIAVAAPMQDSNGEIVAGLAATDGQMELALDMIERQIRLALKDTANPWAEVLDGLVEGWGEARSLRASKADTTRFAARQLTIQVTPLREPTPAGAPTGAWAAFVAALEESDLAGLKAYAPLFRDALGEGALVTGWREVAQRYGLGGGGAESLFIRPADGASDDTTIDEVNVGDDGAEIGQP